jgi:hypothetical protein
VILFADVKRSTELRGRQCGLGGMHRKHHEPRIR